VAESITGGWAARYKVTNPAPLAPPLDPEHITPTDVDYVHTTPMWQSTTMMPGLPEEMLASPAPELATGVGPLDYTPESHDYGVGIGSGLTIEESMDRMADWHNDDQGANAAHTWNPQTDRDGPWTSMEMADVPGHGESPATVQYQRTGVGQPNDPNARIGRWFRRWNRQTKIDMHRYDAVPGPTGAQFARPVPAREGDPNGNQLMPPYGNSVAYQAGPQDRFVGQTVRRAPDADGWDANMETDGTYGTIMGAVNGYGLPAWGL